MNLLGGQVREAPFLEEASFVAAKTMERVRARLDALAAELWPEPPAMLDALEAALGPLPLSIRAFYLAVGAVRSGPIRVSGLSEQLDRLLGAPRGEQDLYLGPGPAGAPMVIPLPDRGADAVLVSEGANLVAEGEPLFFVRYLRDALGGEL